MFKLLIWIALIYLIYRAVGILQRRSASRQGRMPDPGHLPVDDVMVKDPVCETYFPKRSGVTAVVEGKEIHFCSDACRQRYLSGPPRQPAA
jgi:YHS domain-containing protein